MVIPTIVTILKYSKDYKASYIYLITNTKNTQAIHKATFKACLINLIIHIYLIESIVFVYFYKCSVISNLIVIFLVLIFITIITFKGFKNMIPFSLPFDLLKKDVCKVTILLINTLTLIMAGIHLLISFIGSVAVNIYILVLLALNILLFKSTFKIS